jgi:hypothetical protein
MPPDKGQKHRNTDDLLDWFTVSYRTLYLASGIVALLAIGGGVYYYLTREPAAPQPVEAPRATVTSARFNAIEGSVKVKTVGTFEWVTADKSMVLRRSDLVRTGPGSTAEIAFFDGTVVHVRPDSLITIEESSEDPSTKARKVSWHISSGEVNLQTTRRNVPGSATEVSTPTVKSTVSELAAANIKVAEAGDSDIRIFRGTGRVETKTGEKIELTTSQAVRIDATGKAGPKFTLPDIPVLLAPPHQADISYPVPSQATTLLAWKSVANAAGYHFQIDYSAYFNRPIVDRKGWKSNSIELRGLDAGKYYWRVAALDKDGNEGQFSDFYRFAVGSPSSSSGGSGPPPPLAIQSLEVRTNILQIKGRTEAGATVTVNGQRVDVQGDGSFNEFITLDQPGKQVVAIRATGINGGVREIRRPVEVGAF